MDTFELWSYDVSGELGQYAAHTYITCVLDAPGRVRQRRSCASSSSAELLLAMKRYGFNVSAELFESVRDTLHRGDRNSKIHCEKIVKKLGQ